MLETKSLWYHYKAKVWSQKTPEAAVVHNAMRILRSIRYTGPFAYVSSPITTGKFFYELARQEPRIPDAELRERAFDHNYSEGWEFVERLRQRIAHSILFPADLIPARQHWEQDHFQALWLSIIAEKCSEIHMGKDWQFSSGCCEEFTHAAQLKLGLPRCEKNLIFFNTKEPEESERRRMQNIMVFDYVGRPISLAEGGEMIDAAISWLRARDIEALRLEYCRELLTWTQEMIEEGFYQ